MGMPTVYTTGTYGARVHLSAECRLLHRAGYHPIQAIELADVRVIKLCKGCFPEQPKELKLRHQACPICDYDRPHPCKHNGGMKGPTGHYVWPENFYRYTLAKSSQRD